MKKRVLSSIGIIASVCMIFGLSLLFVQSIPTSADNYDVVDFELDDFLSASEIDISDTYETVDLESDITDYSASGKTIEYINNYGDFKFNANDKGKVAKYTSDSLKEGYLIKGSVTFEKYDIKFSGSFYVNTSNRVMLYKGDMTLPNSDKYSGTFDIENKGNSYKKGTYTWKNGESYKGKFSTYSTKNSSGTKVLKSCLDSGSDKSYYYFKSEKEYLYISFAKGVPTGTGTYYKSGKKYTVKYDANGKCISTKEA